MGDDMDSIWRPNGRPQSLLAQSFSDDLDDLFQINSGIDSLSQSVDEKRKTVFVRSQELEALHTRLLEAEERLKQAKSVPPSQDVSAREYADELKTDYVGSSPTRAQQPMAGNKEPKSKPETVIKNGNNSSVPGGQRKDAQFSAPSGAKESATHQPHGKIRSKNN